MDECACVRVDVLSIRSCFNGSVHTKVPCHLVASLYRNIPWISEFTKRRARVASLYSSTGFRLECIMGSRSSLLDVGSSRISQF